MKKKGGGGETDIEEGMEIKREIDIEREERRSHREWRLKN